MSKMIVFNFSPAMLNEPNIVIIGAGSASFGLENLTGIMAHEDLRGACLALVDINKRNLNSINKLANNINKEWNSDMKIVSTTDRLEVLPDADFVILSVALDREDTWLKDHEIGKKYGIWHYAENGGPGSFGHTARGLAFIMPILYDIRDLAPDSLLINFTNPVPRVGYAAQYAGVKSVGLCHQIWHGYGILGRYLASDLKITENLDYEFTWTDEGNKIFAQFIVDSAREYDIKAAGINHFTWMTDVRRKDTWEDLYPLIHEGSKNIYPKFEPLTQHLFKIFGLLPVSGDCHLAEYLPYTYTKENWKKYNIQLYDFERGKNLRKAMWEKISSIISGKKPLDIAPISTERADWVIAEIVTNANAYENAVNISNNGSISNLPNDAIVEVPALVNSHGVSGMKMGNLPEGIAALCEREINIAKLITKASIEGARDISLQAFALMVDDLALAEKLLDDYLTTHKRYLPQFFSENGSG